MVGLLTAGITLAEEVTPTGAAASTDEISAESTDAPVPTEATEDEKPAPAEVEPAPTPDIIPLPRPNPFPRRAKYSARQEFKMPAFDPSWGLSADVYEEAVQAYQRFSLNLENNRFVTVIDLGKSAREKRFFLFDLLAKRVDDFLTTHGKKSDPKNTGLADDFSNEQDSLKSSLGTFLTLRSYNGEHGYSLRLRGLDHTNYNAEKRAIVIHSAPYVSELALEVGRSWGCFVLDPILNRAIIDRIKGNSLIYVGFHRPEKAKKEKPAN